MHFSKQPFTTAPAAPRNFVAGWDHPSQFAPVKSWAENLALAANDPNSDWEVVGRAALILHDDLSYSIKLARQLAASAGYVFKLIGADDVLSFFAEGVQELSDPTLVFAHAGSWSQSARRGLGAEFIEFQDRFAEMLAAWDASCAVALVTQVEEAADVAQSLRCVGGFDHKFEIRDLSLGDRGAMFLNDLPKEICHPSLFQKQDIIGQVLELEADNERQSGLIVMALRRLAHRENRQVGFMDFMEFALHGTCQQVSGKSREQIRSKVAIHEAGHALISLIDSDGRNIPHYAGVKPSAIALGMVSPSYAYVAENLTGSTYGFLRHKVRVLLAGRVAEHIALGLQDMAVDSARYDLRMASGLAFRLVALNGFSPVAEDESTMGSNLYVRDRSGASEAERWRVEQAARVFLKRQYDAVMEMLNANRALLDAIAQRLMVDEVIGQAELVELAMQHGVEVSGVQF